MNAKDSMQLAVWLRSGASMSEVEHACRLGLVGNERFTENARRAFRLAWEWSAPRFSGRIGVRQDALYARHGSAFVARRIERCNRAIRRFLGA